MSLITRCPACETMFKVVPDQLRISDGWVRCGQCGEIFDASQHLVAEPEPEPEPEPATEEEATAPLEKVRAPLEPDPARLVPAPSFAVEAPPIPAVQSAPTASAAQHGVAVEEEEEEESTLSARESVWVPTVAPREETPEPASFAPKEERLVIPSPAPAAREADEEDTPELSFMRDGTRKTLWQRPIVRIVLLVLLLLLLAVLAAQALIHERDRVAAMEPATRPLLLALCNWAGCSLSPLRQIEAVAIESSSFTRVRANNYKLAFSLRNSAAVDLALPAMELSLTDSQDQPLIRRVILPAEFGSASSGTLPAGADWNASLSLGVQPAPGADRIAGYRLLAFYP